MKKFLYGMIAMLPSVCMADSLVQIPSIYVNPNIRESIFQDSKMVQHGYVVISTVEQAKAYFDHPLPDVNFDSQDVILFAWAGSGMDVIDYDEADGIYHFVLKPGMTRDYRQHFKIVVIDKKYEWMFHRVLY